MPEKGPWSIHPLIDPLDPTDVHFRKTPSRTVKSQEGPPLSEEAAFYSEYGLRTGVRTGLELSAFSSTEIQIEAGTSIFVNKEPDPTNTTVIRQSITTTVVTDLFLGDTFTYVFMDNTGAIIQRITPPSDLDDLNNLAFLGQVRHFGGVIVTIDNNAIMAHGASMSHLAELVFNGGVRLKGAEISPNGSSLQVDIPPGILEQVGRGRTINENNPNEYESSAQTPILAGTFFKAYIDGAGDLQVDNSNNFLDPTLFNEDGLGTLVAVSPVNRYTVIRVFEAAGSEAVIFYYGTASYTVAETALVSPELTFVEDEVTIQISPIAKIVIQASVVDFTAAIIAGTAIIQLVSRRV